MTRLFLRLFLLILVSFFIFSNLGVNPINYLRDYQSESYITKQLKGVQYHLIETLRPLTVKQREQWVRKNNKHFNYRLKLGSVTDVRLSASQRKLVKEKNQVIFRLPSGYAKKLKGGEAVFKYSSLYMPLPDSQQVLRMRIYQTNTESYGQTARGSLWLLKQKIASYASVHSGLESIRSFFTYPVAALKVDQVELSQDQLQQLVEEGLVVVYAPKYAKPFQDSRTYMIYSQYKTPQHGEWIIRAGPIDESAVRHNIILLSVLGTAFVLFVPVLLWLLWFWFDLRKFQRTSQDYGSGLLDARLKLAKGSALYLPSQSFNQMADELQKLIEGHKTLVNAVSHELKTPVARLKFALEMLRDATGDDEKIHSEEILQQNITELEGHIQELLLYARYERAITIKALDRQAAMKWLNEIFRRFQNIQPQLTMRLETDDLHDLYIDPLAMRHLLNNLLSNAVEHSNGQILLRLTSSGKHFKLTVEDDGSGVPIEWREKIFEPFSRPDSSRQRTTGGRGLGLAIVRQIAHQHGGQVSCSEGDILLGARFTVTI